jgi:hypothetical protein
MSEVRENDEKTTTGLVNVRIVVTTEIHEKIDAYRKRLCKKRGGEFVSMQEAYTEFLRTRL